MQVKRTYEDRLSPDDDLILPLPLVLTILNALRHLVMIITSGKSNKNLFQSFCGNHRYHFLQDLPHNLLSNVKMMISISTFLVAMMRRMETMM